MKHYCSYCGQMQDEFDTMAVHAVGCICGRCITIEEHMMDFGRKVCAWNDIQEIEQKERRQKICELRDWITRDMLKAEPGALFVFGDNMKRVGLGGQARAMRGEPNAIGLVTKASPWVFFTDGDLLAVMHENIPALERLVNHQKRGGKIVIPAKGIGTGLAELAQRAPLITAYYETVLILLGAKQ